MDIEIMKNRILLLKDFLKMKEIIDDYYVGMGLDKVLYKLNNPTTFEEFNNNLKIVLDKLKEVDVIININDFNYNLEVNKFMETFVNSQNDEKVMKDLFDKLYWDNHNVLSDIVLNIKDILNVNQNKIEEFTKKKMDIFMTENNIDSEKAGEELDNLESNVKELIDTDKNMFLAKFTSGEINIDDYLDDSSLVLTSRNKLISEESFGSLSDEEKNFFYDNIKVLMDNLYEYENYFEFKFLIKHLNIIYPKKDSYNGVHLNKKKELEAVELEKKKLDELLKKETNSYIKLLNKKIWFFFSEKKKNLKKDLKLKTIQTINNDIDKKVIDIKKFVGELNTCKFQNAIFNNINENSTIYEVFNLYKNNYDYLLNVIKTSKKGIKLEEVLDKLDKFYAFMNCSYVRVMKKILFLEAEKMDKIIEEKYQLFGFSVDIDKIGTPVYNDLKNAVNVITIYRNIKHSGLIIEEYKKLIEDAKPKEEVIESVVTEEVKEEVTEAL